MFAPLIRKPQPAAPAAPHLLQRKCAWGAPTPSLETCAACAGERSGVQRKLAIGSSNDPLEREADRVAEQVLANRTQSDFSRVPISVQRHTPEGAHQSQEAPPSVHRALAMSGRPLDAPVCQDMEARFGHDFSQVRIHADGDAARSAREVGANAYTVGRDIVFAHGKFAPDSGAGRRLLAHELTHVLQQGGDASGIVQRDTIDDIKEYLSYAIDDWMVTEQEAKLAFQLLKSLPEDQQAAVLMAEEELYLGRLYDHLPSASLPELAQIAVKVLTVPRLKARRKSLKADVADGSEKSFGDVGGSIAKLKMVEHELAVRTTGKGIYVGNKADVQTPGATATDCTLMVIEVLGDLFKQQEREKEWEIVEAAYLAEAATTEKEELTGLHIQTALQTKLGWVGIYWAPDPKYPIPREELGGWDPKNPEGGIQSVESADTFRKATGKDGKQGTYYSNPKEGIRGINIDHTVVRYAPQVPNKLRKPGYPEASTTPKNESGLEKLKKLPFGVLTAHGAFHMAIITYGKVIEAHWRAASTDVRVITESDIETWEKGVKSGYHWLASGAIVAPADDVAEAFD